MSGYRCDDCRNYWQSGCEIFAYHGCFRKTVPDKYNIHSGSYDLKPEDPEKINIDGNCSSYKRKWWKIWAKK